MIIGTEMAILGLAIYGIGGFIILTIEGLTYSYPLFVVERDPILNFLLSICGVCLSVSGFILITLSAASHTSRVDRQHLIILGIVVGSLGLAILRLSLQVFFT